MVDLSTFERVSCIQWCGRYAKRISKSINVSKRIFCIVRVKRTKISTRHEQYVQLLCLYRCVNQPSYVSNVFRFCHGRVQPKQSSFSFSKARSLAKRRKITSILKLGDVSNENYHFYFSGNKRLAALEYWGDVSLIDSFTKTLQKVRKNKSFRYIIY